MKKVVSPIPVSGALRAPSSKSMMQRAVAAATLASGESVIESPSYSADGKASLQIAQALGAEVIASPERVVIRGGGRPTGDALHCGESGLSIRLFSAIASLYSEPLQLVAEGSLRKRPMDMVVTTLQQLGAEVSSDRAFPPLTIKGPIRSGAFTVDGSLSSQFISGLLFALPCLSGDSTLEVTNLKSRPYVDMTLELLADFGVSIEARGSTFHVPGGQRFVARSYTVEGDWSGASFPLVAGAIGGEVTVHNLRPDSKQADRAILEALRLSGAELQIDGSSVTVGTSTLRGFEFNATDCPDLFPPLVALALNCDGVTTLRGAERLLHKESNRSAALVQEFGKLGGKLTVDGDIMRVHGGTLRGGDVFSHDDHRIAMSCAVAAIRAEGPVVIDHAEAVSKSYPEFYDDLFQLQEEA